MRNDPQLESEAPTLLLWRFFLAATTPLIIGYFLATGGTGTEFQSASCVMQNPDLPPPPVKPSQTYVAILSATSMSAPVWLAMIFANYRKRPKTTIWLFLFAATNSGLGILGSYLVKVSETTFHDFCNDYMSQKTGPEFEDFMAVIIIALVAAIIATLIYGTFFLIARLKPKFRKTV